MYARNDPPGPRALFVFTGSSLTRTDRARLLPVDHTESGYRLQPLLLRSPSRGSTSLLGGNVQLGYRLQKLVFMLELWA